MLENRQLAVFKGKCRQFRNSSECFKTHCGANNWPIWTQKVPKEAQRRGLQASIRLFPKIFWYTWTLNSRLSKMRSLHTYVMPRTVNFGWICIKYINKSLALLDAVINSVQFTQRSVRLVRRTFKSGYEINRPDHTKAC